MNDEWPGDSTRGHLSTFPVRIPSCIELTSTGSSSLIRSAKKAGIEKRNPYSLLGKDAALGGCECCHFVISQPLRVAASAVTQPVFDPDAIMDRMAAAQTREEQLAAGIQIARESVARIRARVAGIQASAPLGRISAALAVIEP